MLKKKQIDSEIAVIKASTEALDSEIEAIKTELVDLLPTDTYSCETMTLSKRPDFKMDIDQTKLTEAYLKFMPDKTKIKEALNFGMNIDGVSATPVTTLVIRLKKNV